MKKPYRWLFLSLLIIAFILFFWLKLYKYVSFSSLKEHRQALLIYRDDHIYLTSFIFILIYIIAVAISIPGASILTLTAGFLFGLVWGTIYVVISATIGAGVIFLAVKSTLGELLKSKASSWVKRLEKGFQKNAFSYLLFLRLIPLFPFWVVNIVPGILNIRFRVFVIATLLGIIPGTVVYVSIGNGLGQLFDLGKTPDLQIIFRPVILLPLIALALLSVVPILYKKIKSKKGSHD